MTRFPALRRPPRRDRRKSHGRRWGLGLAVACLTVALAWVLPAAATDPTPRRTFGLFGSLEFRVDDLSAIPQWTGMLARHADDAARLAACDADPSACRSPRVLAWRAHIQAQTGRHVLTQLQAVNRFVNQAVPYRGDLATFGASDYWATPLEFLRSGGDCEDFAVMKYLTLSALGVPDDRMRIVVVADTVRNLPHAVLAVEVDERTYILDSLFDPVVGHERLRQYLPQYSVNMTYRWAHVVTPELIDRFHRQAVP